MCVVGKARWQPRWREAEKVVYWEPLAHIELEVELEHDWKLESGVESELE